MVIHSWLLRMFAAPEPCRWERKMNNFDFKEPERKEIKTEKDFQEFIKKNIENLFKKNNFNFIIIENFGLDLAIFIEKKL
ncbi:MAG: hypothetical protein LWW94_10310 [Candidatus Desulfofervidaceae bacterium]|nr:hypothetical protein [Candidatus Desulfofervidaceae bacterium]